MFLLSAFLFLLAQVSSSFVLTGRVSDAETGETLVGSVVLAKEINKGTQTDKNGRYELALPAGIHIIVIQYVGFRTPNTNH